MNQVKRVGAYTFQLSPEAWATEIVNLRSRNYVVRRAALRRLGLPEYAAIVSPQGGTRCEGQSKLDVPRWEEVKR